MSRRVDYTRAVGLGQLAHMGRGAFRARRRVGRLSSVVEVDENEVDDAQPSPPHSPSSSASDTGSPPRAAVPYPASPTLAPTHVIEHRVLSLDTIGLPQYFSVQTHVSSSSFSPGPRTARARPALAPAFSSPRPVRLARPLLLSLGSDTLASLQEQDEGPALCHLPTRHRSPARAPSSGRAPAPPTLAPADPPRTPRADDLPLLAPDDSPGLSTPSLDTPYTLYTALLPDPHYSGPPSPTSSITDAHHSEDAKPLLPSRTERYPEETQAEPSGLRPRKKTRSRSAPPPSSSDTPLLYLLADLVFAILRLAFFCSFTSISLVLFPTTRETTSPVKAKARAPRPPTARRRSPGQTTRHEM